MTEPGDLNQSVLLIVRYRSRFHVYKCISGEIYSLNLSNFSIKVRALKRSRIKPEETIEIKEDSKTRGKGKRN